MSAYIYLKTLRSADGSHTVTIERGRGTHPHHIHCSCGEYCAATTGPAGAEKAATTHLNRGVKQRFPA